MNQLILILLVGVVYVVADDEPFSIGLGVLSPSYKQTVGKENVKVSFDQKENGQFSYSVGDPKTGSNSFLTFGPAASGPQQGYDTNSPAGGYGNSFTARKPEDSPSMIVPAGFSYHATEGQSFLKPEEERKPEPSPGQFLPSGFSYHATEGQAYLRQEERKPEPSPGQFLPSGFSYHATEGQAYLRQEERKPEPSPGQFLPSGFSYHATEGQAYLRPQEERKPQSNSGQFLPSGFSYHATDGQAFFNQDESPNFLVAEEKGSSGSGPAEKSFSQGSSQQGRPVLANGLVGYGSSGSSAAGSLPIGAYAVNQGYYKDHGGHS